MSSEDDSPLIRWARRKQAARTGGGDPGAESLPAGMTESAARAIPAERPPAASEAAAEKAAEPPPSLDALTAESDLVAFLRQNVPEQVKKAALRKMWSLDPAIRDHIGLVENGWDFNQPESIPGFGSIADADLSDFFSTPASDAPPATNAPAASVRAPDVAAAGTRLEPAPRDTVALAAEEPAVPRPLPESKSEKDEASDTAHPAIASRHGGALPRE
jgi:hypothetical protein